MPYRAAVIGLGPHGLRVVGALAALENVELTAVVDRRDEALAAMTSSPAARRLRSLDELWQCGPLDLVCIATNGPSHAQLAVDALNHGVRHLMIAKPMACSPAECDEILAVARRSGARVAVDHVRRHAPSYVWLRERIASGAWGEVRAVWMQRPGIGLGCLATHSFDYVRFLTGANVQSVTAWVDRPLGTNPRGAEFVDPGGLVVLQLAGGARAVVAQIEDGAGPATTEIDLTAARVRLDEKSGEIEVIERDVSVKPGPGRSAVFRRGVVPDGLSAAVDMHPCLMAMLGQLLSNEPLICDAEHGRTSIEILAAAHLSHRRGNTAVTFPNDSDELRNLWLPVT